MTGSAHDSIGGIEFGLTDLGDDALAPPPLVADSDLSLLDAEYVDVEAPVLEEVNYCRTEAGTAERPRRQRLRVRRRRVPPAPRVRGLALRELTLRHTRDGWGARFWDWVTNQKSSAEVFFVSTAIDGSGAAPFVWPLDGESASLATTYLEEGETFRWTLGDGAPIFGPKVIQGGLAVSIVVAESHAEARGLGEALEKVSGTLGKNEELTSLLATLSGPVGFAAQTAREALGLATALVSDALQLRRDRRLGTYAGLYSAAAPWTPSKLRQADHRVSIRLVEVQ